MNLRGCLAVLALLISAFVTATDYELVVPNGWNSLQSSPLISLADEAHRFKMGDRIVRVRSGVSTNLGTAVRLGRGGSSWEAILAEGGTVEGFQGRIVLNNTVASGVRGYAIMTAVQTEAPKPQPKNFTEWISGSLQTLPWPSILFGFGALIVISAIFLLKKGSPDNPIGMPFGNKRMIDEGFRDVRARLDQITAAQTELVRKPPVLRVFRKDIETFHNRLNKLETANQAAQRSLSNITAALTTLEEKLGTIAEQCNTITSDQKNAVDTLTRLNAEFSKSDEKGAALHQELAASLSRLDILQRQLDQLGNAQAEVGAALQQNQKGTDESFVATHKALAEMHTSLGEFSKRLQAISDAQIQLTEQQAQLSGMPGTLDQAFGQIEQLDKGNKITTEQLTDLQTEIESLRMLISNTAREALNPEQFEALRANFDEFRGQVQGFFNETAQRLSAIDNRAVDFSRQLETLPQQVQVVEVAAPARKERRKPVLEVHEEPVVEPEVVQEPVAEEPMELELHTAEEVVEPVAEVQPEAVEAEELPAVEEIPEPVAEEIQVEEPAPIEAEQIEPEPVEVEPYFEEAPVVEPAAEEPVAEEPAAEEPVVLETVAEEPPIEEPVVSEPLAEEPHITEPVAQEPQQEPEVILEVVSAEAETEHEPEEEEVEFNLEAQKDRWSGFGGSAERRWSLELPSCKHNVRAQKTLKPLTPIETPGIEATIGGLVYLGNAVAYSHGDFLRSFWPSREDQSVQLKIQIPNDPWRLMSHAGFLFNVGHRSVEVIQGSMWVHYADFEGEYVGQTHTDSHWAGLLSWGGQLAVDFRDRSGKHARSPVALDLAVSEKIQLAAHGKNVFVAAPNGSITKVDILGATQVQDALKDTELLSLAINRGDLFTVEQRDGECFGKLIKEGHAPKELALGISELPCAPVLLEDKFYFFDPKTQELVIGSFKGFNKLERKPMDHIAGVMRMVGLRAGKNHLLGIVVTDGVKSPTQAVVYDVKSGHTFSLGMVNMPRVDLIVAGTHFVLATSCSYQNTLSVFNPFDAAEAEKAA